MKRLIPILFIFYYYTLFASSQIQWVNYGASIYLNGADYARNGDRVAYSFWNYIEQKNIFQVWDISNSKKILEITDSPFTYFSLSADGKIVAYWSWQDSVLTFWDVDNNIMKSKVKTDYYVNGLKFLDENNIILRNVKDKDNYFNILDSKSLNIVKSCKIALPDSTYELDATIYTQNFDFTPDGNNIVTSARRNHYSENDTAKTVQLVLIDMNNCITKFEPISNERISSISVSKVKVNDSYIAAVLLSNIYFHNDTIYNYDTLNHTIDTIYSPYSSDTSFIQVWNINEAKLFKNIPFIMKEGQRDYSDIKFNGDGKKLFMLKSYNGFSLFNLETETVENSMYYSAYPVYFYPYNTNSFLYISGYQTNKYDYSQNQNTLLLNNYNGSMHIAGINSIAVTKDNKTVVTSSNDGTIKFWNADDGSIIKTYNFPGIKSFKLSPDDSKIALCTDNPNPVLQLIKTGTGESIWSISQQFHNSIYCTAYSSDGKYVAVSTYQDSIYVLDAVTGSKVYAFDGGTWINSIDFSPDNKYLSAGNDNGGLTIWTMADGSKYYFKDKYGQNTSPSIYSLKFSGDGKWLAVGFSDCFIRLLETTNWSILSQYDCKIGGISYAPFRDVEFLNGNKYLLGIDIALVRSYDLQGNYNLFNYDEWYGKYWNEEFNIMAPSSDSKFLIVGTSYGTIIRWRGIEYLPVDDEKSSQNTNIFPNPTSEKIFISFNNMLDVQFSLDIYNTLGERVSDKFYNYQNIKNRGIEVDCTNMQNGIYYLNFSFNGIMIHKQFVVIR